MQQVYGVSAHWHGGFHEAALMAWAEEIRGRLQAERVTLGLVFMSPQFFPHAAQTLEVLRLHARIPLLLGCSSNSLIAGAREFEANAGLVLALYHLPRAKLTACHFTPEQVEEAESADFWHKQTGITPADTNGWLVFADPFHLDAERWLRGWNEAFAPKPILGGLASGDHAAERTQVYLDGEVYEEGGVALSIAGEVSLLGVISQGCTPIGETWTITKADGHYIHEIANRPAYEVLAETFHNLTPTEQQKTRGNLFVGLAMNEYREEFQRGDFLVRNLLGADPEKGTLVVGAQPRGGQTMQFQRRDADAATEDILDLLQHARNELGDRPVYGACLCCCNGRGSGLFGQADHDAELVQQQLHPPGLAGFFCNGEIGPVGERNFLHGYTASLALFVGK